MLRGMILIVYYVVITKLPHSRLCRPLSNLRRWYVSRLLKIMIPCRDATFEYRVYIGSGQHVHIGSHCRINEDVFIQGGKIGNYVLIAPNVAILSRSHNHGRTDIPMLMQGQSEPSPPTIEDDVWIGRNAVIMPGVRIGRGSIVGAGAIVVRDVEPYSVVGGVPARLIRMRLPKSGATSPADEKNASS